MVSSKLLLAILIAIWIYHNYADKMNKTVNEVSDIINFFIAEIAYKIIECIPSIQDIYISGGDITTAFCKACHTLGLKLLAEPVPLAAEDVLIVGDFPDKHIVVTEDGMTGNFDTINTCIAKHMTELNI